MKTLPPNLQIKKIRDSKSGSTSLLHSKKFSCKLMLALHCVALFALAVPNSIAVGVISDDFSPNTIGTMLAGTVTPVGSGTWQNTFVDTTNPLKFSADGIVSTDDGEGAAVVNLDSIRTIDAVNYTLSAELNPFGMGDDGWAVLMFNQGPGAGILNGQLWMFLTNTGYYAVVYDGTASAATDGASAPGFVSEGLNLMTLSYNSDLNTASASINGTPVLTNFNLGAFSPDPAFAGIGFRPAAGYANGGGQAANFSVVTSVPEPGSVALIMLAGATLGFRVLRRKRTLIEA